jgi:hypothetical protein
VNVILKCLWQETSQKDEFKLEDLKLRNTHFDRHGDSPEKVVVINFPSPAVRSPRTETQHWKLHNTTQQTNNTKGNGFLERAEHCCDRDYKASVDR